MNPTVVADQMVKHIRGQVLLFREMCTLQADLLQRLDSGEGMPIILDLLAKKNSLLEQVNLHNLESADIVAAWPDARTILGNQQEAMLVNKLLDELEIAVKELRIQDESMILRFQSVVTPKNPAERERHSQNVMNAFRAMR